MVFLETSQNLQAIIFERNTILPTLLNLALDLRNKNRQIFGIHCFRFLYKERVNLGQVFFFIIVESQDGLDGFQVENGIQIGFETANGLWICRKIIRYSDYLKFVAITDLLNDIKTYIVKIVLKYVRDILALRSLSH